MRTKKDGEFRSSVYTQRPPYADFDAPQKFQAIQSIILRPLYYVSGADKQWYKNFYGIRYSDAYEVYGLKRTGCCGCAISARASSDLELIRQYEPNVVKAAWAIFGDSYRYRAKYNEYKAMRREQEKTRIQETPKVELPGQITWEDVTT